MIAKFVPGCALLGLVWIFGYGRAFVYERFMFWGVVS